MDTQYKISMNNPLQFTWKSFKPKLIEYIMFAVFFGLIAVINHISDVHKQCIPTGIDIFDDSNNTLCSNNITGFNPAINYPHKSSTVNYVGLVSSSPVPWVVIILFCVITTNILIARHYGIHLRIGIIILKIECILRNALMSILFAHLTQTVIKYNVGRPRPNFNKYWFDDPKDARKSFPSGHATFSFSIYFLLSIYLIQTLYNIRNYIIYNNKVNKHELQLNSIISDKNIDIYFGLNILIYFRNYMIICLLLCLSPGIFALYVGCTRLTDYKHHYSDVLAGILIGVSSSFLSYFYYYPELYYGFDYNIALKLQKSLVKSPYNSDSMTDNSTNARYNPISTETKSAES